MQLICLYSRYAAVTHPIKYAKHKNSQRLYMMIALPWLVSVAISSPIALGLNYTDKRAETPDLCTFYNSDFLIYSSMGSFYIPCIVMLILYWRIYLVIRSRGRRASFVVKAPPASGVVGGEITEGGEGGISKVSNGITNAGDLSVFNGHKHEGGTPSLSKIVGVPMLVPIVTPAARKSRQVVVKDEQTVISESDSVTMGDQDSLNADMGKTTESALEPPTTMPANFVAPNNNKADRPKLKLIISPCVDDVVTEITISRTQAHDVRAENIKSPTDDVTMLIRKQARADCDDVTRLGCSTTITLKADSLAPLESQLTQIPGRCGAPARPATISPNHLIVTNLNTLTSSTKPITSARTDHLQRNNSCDTPVIPHCPVSCLTFLELTPTAEAYWSQQSPTFNIAADSLVDDRLHCSSSWDAEGTPRSTCYPPPSYTNGLEVASTARTPAHQPDSDVARTDVGRRNGSIVSPLQFVKKFNFNARQRTVSNSNMKRAAKRERKATKTLAIVLGKVYSCYCSL